MFPEDFIIYNLAGIFQEMRYTIIKKGSTPTVLFEDGTISVIFSKRDREELKQHNYIDYEEMFRILKKANKRYDV